MLPLGWEFEEYIPEYRSRSGKVITLIDRVNDCFERSMKGKALAYNSAEMINILSYMQWLSVGVPTGTAVKGRGFGAINTELKPDSANGKVIYAEKCASCRSPQGLEVKTAIGGYAFPPPWGKDSFNVGAGMARTYTVAAFVKHKMPLGQGGTLSDQHAIDVSEYFTHQARPVYKDKTKDWPQGNKPTDARNYPQNQPPHQISVIYQAWNLSNAYSAATTSAAATGPAKG